jgi:LmbE family N-acetylglucosaminyl deacetylase
MAKPAYKAVFVSPHLDDAVFSCGGEISRLAKAGPVLVLNLFTRYLSETRLRGVVLGEARLREEADAASHLGYESRNLDELDAPFRRKPYLSVGNLFRPPVPADMEYLSELRARVFTFLEGIEFERIYVPLAVGWHVDHLLAHHVFEPWARRDGLLFYEDVPYCLIPHATRHRLDELADYRPDPADRSLAPVGRIREWWQASRAYADTAMMRNLQPWIVRQFAVPVVSMYLFRLLALHRRQAAGSSRRLRLEPLIKPLGDELAGKLEAMALYRSQFGEFFSDRDDCLTSLAAYARWSAPRSGPLERYWRAALAD